MKRECGVPIEGTITISLSRVPAPEMSSKKVGDVLTWLERGKMTKRDFYCWRPSLCKHTVHTFSTLPLPMILSTTLYIAPAATKYIE